MDRVWEDLPESAGFGVRQAEDLGRDLVYETRGEDDLATAEGVGPAGDLSGQLLHQTDPSSCLALHLQHLDVC